MKESKKRENRLKLREIQFSPVSEKEIRDQPRPTGKDHPRDRQDHRRESVGSPAGRKKEILPRGLVLFQKCAFCGLKNYRV